MAFLFETNFIKEPEVYLIEYKNCPD